MVIGTSCNNCKQFIENVFYICGREVEFLKINKKFVRIKKEAAEEAKKVFGDVEIISLGQLPQECAFITDEMTQGAFEEKLAQIGDQVLAKIRVKD